MKAELRRVTGSVALVALLSAYSCEQNDGQPPVISVAPEQVGRLSLGVELADQTDVKTIEYVVTRDDEWVRGGEMPVQDDRTGSATEANLEAGDGYRVDLTAARRYIQPCKAIAHFEVKAGVITPVPVAFQCEPTGPDGPAP